MRRVMIAVLALWGILMAGIGAASAVPNPDPTGVWLTETGKAAVSITPCGNRYCAEIAWLAKPVIDGQPARDIHNPDPALRQRPICGLSLIGGFVPAGPNHWEDGLIYDPENGGTYHASLELLPDGRMRVRGYIGIPLFGESQIWKHPDTPLPPCGKV